MNEKEQADSESAQENHYEKDKDEIMTKTLEKLKEFKVQRDAVEKIKEAMDAEQQKFNEAHKVEIVSLAQNRERLNLMEDGLRDLALEEYALTKDKKLTGGMGIRILKKLDYESDKALIWAEQHHIGLTLDKRAFESFAKSQEADLKKAKLDFVTIREEATATIPKEIKIEDG